jgi:hypothetical protein
LREQGVEIGDAVDTEHEEPLGGRVKAKIAARLGTAY